MFDHTRDGVADHGVAGSGDRAGRRTLTQGLGRVQRRAASGHDVTPEAIEDAAGRGVATPSSALPYRDAIQASFGRHRVDQVQAHVDGEAAASADAMGAQAYAVGDHVVLGGAPTLHTVAHEAAHVIQQRAGVARKGGGGDDGFERHADAVADAVAAGRSAEALLDQLAGQGAGADPAPHVQRLIKVGGEPLTALPDTKGPNRGRAETMLEDERTIWSFDDPADLNEFVRGEGGAPKESKNPDYKPKAAPRGRKRPRDEDDEPGADDDVAKTKKARVTGESNDLGRKGQDAKGHGTRGKDSKDAKPSVARGKDAKAAGATGNGSSSSSASSRSSRAEAEDDTADQEVAAASDEDVDTSGEIYERYIPLSTKYVTLGVRNNTTIASGQLGGAADIPHYRVCTFKGKTARPPVEGMVNQGQHKVAWRAIWGALERCIGATLPVAAGHMADIIRVGAPDGIATEDPVVTPVPKDTPVPSEVRKLLLDAHNYLVARQSDGASWESDDKDQLKGKGEAGVAAPLQAWQGLPRGTSEADVAEVFAKLTTSKPQTIAMHKLFDVTGRSAEEAEDAAARACHELEIHNPVAYAEHKGFVAAWAAERKTAGLAATAERAAARDARGTDAAGADDEAEPEVEQKPKKGKAKPAKGKRKGKAKAKASATSKAKTKKAEKGADDDEDDE